MRRKYETEFGGGGEKEKRPLPETESDFKFGLKLGFGIADFIHKKSDKLTYIIKESKEELEQSPLSFKDIITNGLLGIAKTAVEFNREKAEKEMERKNQIIKNSMELRAEGTEVDTLNSYIELQEEIIEEEFGREYPKPDVEIKPEDKDRFREQVKSSSEAGAKKAQEEARNIFERANKQWRR